VSSIHTTNLVPSGKAERTSPRSGHLRAKLRHVIEIKHEGITNAMTKRGQSVLLCQTRNRGGRLIYDPEHDLYQCLGRGKDCRFAENADGSLQRFGADCGRLPSSDR